MCFAPQRRTLATTSGRHQDVHKWPQHVVSCTCLLPNVLRAATACTFSTTQLPKVVRDRRVLPLFTSKCASRHNSVHFFNISTSESSLNLMCFDTFFFQMCFAPERRATFISYLPRCLRTCRFSEPTFRPSGATKHWKNTVFRDFPTFSRTCSFSLF